MPVLFRYASAFSAMPRGSRSYGSRVIGSTIVQMRLSVGSALKGIDPGGRRIRNHEHVAGVDRAPATNTRAIEAEALGENLFVVFSESGREMLPGARQVGELEVHEFYLAIFD